MMSNGGKAIVWLAAVGVVALAGCGSFSDAAISRAGPRGIGWTGPAAESACPLASRFCRPPDCPTVERSAEEVRYAPA